jgi:hypothetical protein
MATKKAAAKPAKAAGTKTTVKTAAKPAPAPAPAQRVSRFSKMLGNKPK